MELNSSNLQRFWEFFGKYHLPLIIDLGPVGSKGYQFGGIRRSALFPSLNQKDNRLSRGGASHNNEIVQEMQKRWMEFLSIAQKREFYVGLAALPSFFDEEYPYPVAQKYVEITFETLGAEHLPWGSDMPGILSREIYRQALDIIREHCTFLSSSEKRLVLGDNAFRIYRADLRTPVFY